MAYADVSKPIVIQASKSLAAKVDNYLRRMCIVSEGGSNLGEGNFKEINSSQIEEILSTQVGNEAAANDLKRKLNGFFAFANDKDVMVVEVGAFETQGNPISKQVQRLRDYIEDSGKKSYCHLVPSSWYWPKESQVQIPNSEISISQALYALRPAVPEDQTLPEEGNVTQPVSQATLGLSTNIPEENLKIFISPEGVVSYDAETDMLTAIAQGEATITISGKKDPLEGETALVQAKIKVGTWNANLELSQDEKTLEGQSVEDQTENATKPGSRDLAFLSLVDAHTSMASKTFFFIEIAKEAPSTSEAFQTYANKKSLFTIYDNLVSTSSYPLSSIILGIAASSRYDLSAMQHGTPMNFKTLSGQNFDPLKRAMVKELIDAPSNFAGALAGNCVLMNGRYMDGTAWEYYYQWNVVEFEIELKLQMLLLNGVNSASSVIQYNQNGIDILKANIKSVLMLWQERGVITSFARSLDAATGYMVGEGDISSIDFAQYISQNPEDYKNEVYRGFSFYIMIGRYPRQIVIEASLN